MNCFVFAQVLSLALLAAEHPSLHRYEAVEPHMGTLVRITLYTSSQDAAAHAFRAAFDRIANLDRILSDYQPESELSRWYQRRFGEGNTRLRKVGIVALARKLLVALWKYLETGEVPAGAELIAKKKFRGAGVAPRVAS